MRFYNAGKLVTRRIVNKFQQLSLKENKSSHTQNINCRKFVYILFLHLDFMISMRHASNKAGF